MSSTSESHIALLIRIYQTLSEEIFEYGGTLPSQRKKELAKSMREISNNILLTFSSILDQNNVNQFLHSPNQHQRHLLALVFGDVLNALSSICSWINPEHFAKSPLLSILTGLLFLPQFRMKAADVLYVWQSQSTAKNVDINLVALMDHTDSLIGCWTSKTAEEDLEDFSKFQKRVAQIVLKLGQNYLYHCKSSFHAALPKFLRFAEELVKHPSLIVSSLAVLFWDELFLRKNLGYIVSPYLLWQI